MGKRKKFYGYPLRLNTDSIIAYLSKKWIHDQYSPAAPVVLESIEDSYKRLIQPSIEREIRGELTDKGEEQAIHIFSENLRNLLVAAAV